MAAETYQEVPLLMRKDLQVNRAPWYALTEELQRAVHLGMNSPDFVVWRHAGTQWVRMNYTLDICGVSKVIVRVLAQGFAPEPLSAGTRTKVETGLKEYDISTEEYREIQYLASGEVYRIDNPRKLFIRPGGATHRVVDAEGVAHCYAVPESGLTVIRWKNRDTGRPVNF